MKVSLVYLPHPYLREPEAQAPLGLMYLAARLEAEGVDVVIDNLSGVSEYEAIERLTEADLYGITVTSMEVPQGNRFATHIKRRYPQSVVGIGGPGVVSREMVDRQVVDFICFGEAENVITEIVSDFSNGRLAKTYYPKIPQDLDSLFFPARHLLKGSQGGNIFAYGKRYADGESTIVCTSRGCPYKCAFCASPFLYDGSVRYRSAEDVASEIRVCVQDYGIRQFRFSDDMFASNRKRVFEICDLVGPLDVSWRISTRVKPFDGELARAMFSAGCREVSFGVESFDNDVLSVLNKKTTAEDNAKALEIAHDVGMVTRVLFMIRTPGQTKYTVPVNIAWLQRVPYDIVACTSFVPLPGSMIWKHPESYNIEILNRNLDDYNFYFYGRDGENDLKDIIKIRNRPLDEFNEESQRFRDYLSSTGKLNRG